MDYTIWVNNQEVPVSEDVYRVYWKGVRKERYLQKVIYIITHFPMMHSIRKK